MARLGFGRRTGHVYEGMDGQLILCGLLSGHVGSEVR